MQPSSPLYDPRPCTSKNPPGCRRHGPGTSTTWHSSGAGCSPRPLGPSSSSWWPQGRRVIGLRNPGPGWLVDVRGAFRFRPGSNDRDGAPGPALPRRRQRHLRRPAPMSSMSVAPPLRGQAVGAGRAPPPSTMGRSEVVRLGPTNQTVVPVGWPPPGRSGRDDIKRLALWLVGLLGAVGRPVSAEGRAISPVAGGSRASGAVPLWPSYPA